jgi:hypothetical protein
VTTAPPRISILGWASVATAVVSAGAGLALVVDEFTVCSDWPSGVIPNSFVSYLVAGWTIPAVAAIGLGWRSWAAGGKLGSLLGLADLVGVVGLWMIGGLVTVSTCIG